MSAITDTIRHEPVCFHDGELRGLLCAPRGEARRLVLLVSPLFDEKRCAHRALTVCARTLAGAGTRVLHADLYATGNSAGLLTDIGLARWLDDVRAAAAFLRREAALPLCVVGCRAGALLAARAIAGGLAAERLVLWQPVLSGRSYLAQTRTRRKIQDAMTGETPAVGPCEIEGEALSPDLFRELEALALPDDPPTCDVRLLQCSFSAKLTTDHARLVERWGAARLPARCLVAEPFWQAHTPGDYADVATALAAEVTA